MPAGLGWETSRDDETRRVEMEYDFRNEKVSVGNMMVK